MYVIMLVLTGDLDVVHDPEEERARVGGQRVVQVPREALQLQRARRVRDGRHARAALQLRDLTDKQGLLLLFDIQVI